MYDSHESLRKDFEVSTKELDFLVSVAKGVEGVYGSRYVLLFPFMKIPR